MKPFLARVRPGLALAAAVAVAFAALGLAASGGERETLPGPVPARVLRVIDGDTLVVRARLWVGQSLEIHVRLDGVDAPELRGRCEDERARARAARDFVAARVSAGEVALTSVQYDKYGGRVLARIAAPDGTDLGMALIAAGLARAYAGGKRGGWCG